MPDNMDLPLESIPSVDAEPVSPRNVLESEVDLEEETFTKHPASVETQTLFLENLTHDRHISSETPLGGTQDIFGRIGVSLTEITSDRKDVFIEGNAGVREEPLPISTRSIPNDWKFKQFIVELAMMIGEEDLELLKARFSGIGFFFRKHMCMTIKYFKIYGQHFIFIRSYIL